MVWRSVQLACATLYLFNLSKWRIKLRPTPKVPLSFTSRNARVSYSYHCSSVLFCQESLPPQPVTTSYGCVKVLTQILRYCIGVAVARVPHCQPLWESKTATPAFCLKLHWNCESGVHGEACVPEIITRTGSGSAPNTFHSVLELAATRTPPSAPPRSYVPLLGYLCAGNGESTGSGGIGGPVGGVNSIHIQTAQDCADYAAVQGASSFGISTVECCADKWYHFMRVTRDHA